MSYTKINWENNKTPINASNLNHMDNQIAENAEDVATKADAGAVYTREEADELIAGKADANNVYTIEEADEALAAKANASDLNGKLDKVSAASKVYATAGNGEQTSLSYDINATGYTVAYRGAGGRLLVGTPSQNNDAATKKYVDDSKSILTVNNLPSFNAAVKNAQYYVPNSPGKGALYQLMSGFPFELNSKYDLDQDIETKYVWSTTDPGAGSGTLEFSLYEYDTLINTYVWDYPGETIYVKDNRSVFSQASFSGNLKGCLMQAPGAPSSTSAVIFHANTLFTAEPTCAELLFWEDISSRVGPSTEDLVRMIADLSERVSALEPKYPRVGDVISSLSFNITSSEAASIYDGSNKKLLSIICGDYADDIELGDGYVNVTSYGSFQYLNSDGPTVISVTDILAAEGRTDPIIVTAVTAEGEQYVTKA